MPPMLATLTTDYFSSSDWIYEHKLDGQRCLVVKKNGKVRLMSRNDRKINNEYPVLATHYMKEYGEWFLGKNSDIVDTNKEHYVYQYGDLKEVQRCALVDSIAQAEKKGDQEIVRAAKELLELVDKKAK